MRLRPKAIKAGSKIHPACEARNAATSSTRAFARKENASAADASSTRRRSRLAASTRHGIQVNGHLSWRISSRNFGSRPAHFRRVLTLPLALLARTILIHTCSRYILNALTPTLTTTALYRSSLEWFEARSWKPTPKDLPSSLMQLRHNPLVHGEPPSCVQLRHTFDAPVAPYAVGKTVDVERYGTDEVDPMQARRTGGVNILGFDPPPAA
jgi:hypothetical protein